MSTSAPTSVKKHGLKELPTKSFGIQNSVNPMGNTFLSVAGSTVTKILGQQPYGSRLQSARPAAAQIRASARPTTSANKPITDRNSWRPPLQRTKQTSSLPSIAQCNYSSKQNELIQCEEQLGEEESERFRHYHDTNLSRRAVASAASRRFGGRYNHSPPVPRTLISSKSLPSFSSDIPSSNSADQETTTCVDTLLHEVLRNTPVRSTTLTETWSHSRLMGLRPLEKQSSINSAEGVLPDHLAKSSYGVYANPSGACPKVLQPLGNPLRPSYSARGTTNSEIRRPLVERPVFMYTNPKLQNSTLSSNNAEQPISQVTDPVDNGACLIDETLTLNNLSGLAELERYITNPDVTKLLVHRIHFCDLASHISKLQSSENLICLELKETGVSSLRQLESLVQLRNLQHLIIGRENNPITQLSIWIPYLVHRMGHLALTSINGKQITTDMIHSAQQLFGPAVQLVRTIYQRRRGSRAEATTQQTLLQRRDDQTHDDSTHKTNWPVASLTDAEKELIFASKNAARYCVEESTRNCIQSLWKEWLAQRTWPLILKETVDHILEEMADIDLHMKTSMAELEK